MSNKGAEYEVMVVNLLKQYNLTNPSYKPAKDDRNKADALLRIRGIDYALELKMSPQVYFGQGAISYDMTQGKFVFSKQENTNAALALRSLGLPGLAKINSGWGSLGCPRSEALSAKALTEDDVKLDKKTFLESLTIGSIDSSAVLKYYSAKGVEYIQIGGCGLFCIGSDPAGLGVPTLSGAFQTSGRMKYEKKKVTGNIYSRFVLGIKGARVIKSKFDLEDKDYLEVLSALQ